jgi:hypothetical protein
MFQRHLGSQVAHRRLHPSTGPAAHHPQHSISGRFPVRTSQGWLRRLHSTLNGCHLLALVVGAAPLDLAQQGQERFRTPTHQALPMPTRTLPSRGSRQMVSVPCQQSFQPAAPQAEDGLEDLLLQGLEWRVSLVHQGTDQQMEFAFDGLS